MSIDDINGDDATEQSQQDSLSENLEDLNPSFVSGRREPNKGALGFLGLLLICGTAFYFFYLRNGPASVSAATQVQKAASSTIDEFLHGNGGNAHLMAQTLRDSQKVVSEFQASSRKFQIPLGELATNPFRLHAPEAKARQNDDESAARSREQMLADKARIQREAGALELQSVLRGGYSACMINNNLCRLGDQVGNFTVDEIRARTVIVHQGPYRFELAMKKLKSGRGD
jgi:hypothetical protein